MGSYPVSELLEMLLGADSFGDLEHAEVHGLALGLALIDRDDVTTLDISEGGQMH